MDSARSFLCPKNLRWVYSTNDSTARLLANSKKGAVDAGAPPALAIRSPVVSPICVIGIAVQIRSDLISSRTRRRATAHHHLNRSEHSQPAIVSPAEHRWPRL